MTEISTKDILVPDEKLKKWQELVDLLADLTGVNTAVITKVAPPYLEMFIVSDKKRSIIEPGLEVPLDGVFCEEVMKSNQKLLVPNALEDEAWQDEPAVEVGLISYLGFPLRWPDGDYFGTICLRDVKENSFSPETEKIMGQFQELIESHLEVIYQNHQLKDTNQKLSDSLKKGAKIHQHLLPDSMPELENFDLASYYQPASELGGDFYNIIELDNQLVVYLVDVVGHSLDGAMLNMVIREAIHSFLRYSHQKGNSLSPQEIMQTIISRYQEEDFPRDYMVSLIIGVLDCKDLEFKFSNAGMQTQPLLITNTGEISSLECSGFPISTALPEETYSELTEKSVNFTEEMTVLLTTDGLIEEMVDGIIYGEERLKEVLKNNFSASSEQLNQRIWDDFIDFAKAEKGQDDITYLTIKHNKRD